MLFILLFYKIMKIGQEIMVKIPMTIGILGRKMVCYLYYYFIVPINNQPNSWERVVPYGDCLITPWNQIVTMDHGSSIFIIMLGLVQSQHLGIDCFKVKGQIRCTIISTQIIISSWLGKVDKEFKLIQIHIEYLCEKT